MSITATPDLARLGVEAEDLARTFVAHRQDDGAFCASIWAVYGVSSPLDRNDRAENSAADTKNARKNGKGGAENSAGGQARRPRSQAFSPAVSGASTMQTYEFKTMNLSARRDRADRPHRSRPAGPPPNLKAVQLRQPRAGGATCCRCCGSWWSHSGNSGNKAPPARARAGVERRADATMNTDPRQRRCVRTALGAWGRCHCLRTGAKVGPPALRSPAVACPRAFEASLRARACLKDPIGASSPRKQRSSSSG
jgi:hypothetical protein